VSNRCKFSGPLAQRARCAAFPGSFVRLLPCRLFQSPTVCQRIARAALSRPDAFRNGSGDVWGTNFNVLFLSHLSSLAVEVPVPDTRWLDIPLRLIFQREQLYWHELPLSVFLALSEDSLVARRRTQASATAPKGKTEAPRLGSGPVIMSIMFALTRLLKKQAARQPMSMKYSTSNPGPNLPGLWSFAYKIESLVCMSTSPTTQFSFHTSPSLSIHVLHSGPQP
jgi:hypothetical protein